MIVFRAHTYGTPCVHCIYIYRYCRYRNTCAIEVFLYSLYSVHSKCKSLREGGRGCAAAAPPHSRRRNKYVKMRQPYVIQTYNVIIISVDYMCFTRGTREPMERVHIRTYNTTCSIYIYNICIGMCTSASTGCRRASDKYRFFACEERPRPQIAEAGGDRQRGVDGRRLAGMAASAAVAAERNGRGESGWSSRYPG